MKKTIKITILSLVVSMGLSINLTVNNDSGFISNDVNNTENVAEGEITYPYYYHKKNRFLSRKCKSASGYVCDPT